jgi:hypothetical protein
MLRGYWILFMLVLIHFVQHPNPSKATMYSALHFKTPTGSADGYCVSCNAKQHFAGAVRIIKIGIGACQKMLVTPCNWKQGSPRQLPLVITTKNRSECSHM